MSTIDTATTETTAAKRVRGPNERFYIDNNGHVTRHSGDTVEGCSLIGVAPGVWDRLAVEGYIHLRKAGHAHTDILNSHVFPDRAAPVPKEKRAKRVAAPKEPGPWIKAIAQVKAKDMIKAAKSGGTKLTLSDIDGFNSGALLWARTLSNEQIKVLRKHKLVRMAHAEITGEPGSLDDVLAAPVSAGAALEEAAD